MIVRIVVWVAVVVLLLGPSLCSNSNGQDVTYDTLTLDDGGQALSFFPQLALVPRSSPDFVIGASPVAPISGFAILIEPFDFPVFRIADNAAEGQVTVGQFGVALGTQDPQATLHLYGNGVHRNNTPYEHPWILVEDASTSREHRVLMVLANNGGSSLRMENSGTGHSWQTSVLTNGDYRISLDGSGGHEFRLLRNGRLVIGPGNQTVFDLRPNGNLIIDGTLVQLSDRNRKENFRDVNCQEVLTKLSELPLQSWNYRSDEDSIRHIGPMAQDFHKAFGLGMNDTTLATVDLAGVTIAAVQALDERDRSFAEENRQLRERLEDLERRLSQLEAASNSFEREQR